MKSEISIENNNENENSSENNNERERERESILKAQVPGVSMRPPTVHRRR